MTDRSRVLAREVGEPQVFEHTSKHSPGPRFWIVSVVPTIRELPH